MKGLDPELPATPTSLKQWVLASGMLVLVILASLQVFARYLFDRPLAWSEEGVRYVMTWTAFLAAAWSVRDREHITVEIIMPWLGPRLRRVVETLRWLLVAAFCLVLLPSSVRVTTRRARPARRGDRDSAERHLREPAHRARAHGVVCPAAGRAAVAGQVRLKPDVRSSSRRSPAAGSRSSGGRR